MYFYIIFYKYYLKEKEIFHETLKTAGKLQFMRKAHSSRTCTSTEIKRAVAVCHMGLFAAKVIFVRRGILPF